MQVLVHLQRCAICWWLSLFCWTFRVSVLTMILMLFVIIAHDIYHQRLIETISLSSLTILMLKLFDPKFYF